MIEFNDQLSQDNWYLTLATNDQLSQDNWYLTLATNVLTIYTIRF